MKGYVWIAVWLVSLVVTGVWQHSAGVKSERLTWKTTQNAELQKERDEVSRLRAEKDKNAEELAAISAKYQQDMLHEKERNARTIADIRAGDIRLRQPSPPLYQPSGASQAEPGACRRDGAEAGYLSIETSEFLYGLASEADEVVEQLNACQAVIRKDRELNNKEKKHD